MPVLAAEVPEVALGLTLHSVALVWDGHLGRMLEADPPPLVGSVFMGEPLGNLLMAARSRWMIGGEGTASDHPLTAGLTGGRG